MQSPVLTKALDSNSALLERTSQSSMQAMMVQITTDGVPKLHCPACNKALASLSGYVKHLKKHEPPGGFLCRYCEARFCFEEQLKKHRDEIHTTIACRICKDITFTNENDYREHISVVHNGIDREMYKCVKCDAEYKTLEPFKRHQKTECGTIKPFKCDQCDLAFYTKYNLKQHKVTHSGERQFCCSYCGKNFVQKGRLVEHERSHTGEKPYKCDVCGKCFAHRESIVTHSSIHTGIRLVECRCCLSRFSCYSNLIKHRRSRPDTCGLAEYNPPKNRVRTRRARIPPTINPTSEIKVSSLNKVIKPADKIHEKRRSHGTKPESKYTVQHRRATNTELVSDCTTDSDENVESSSLKKPSTRSNSKIMGVGNAPTDGRAERRRKLSWNDETDSSEDYPDCDPANTESEDENLKDNVTFPLPKPPQRVKNERTDDMDGSDFEYTNANDFVNIELNVKSEDEQNIFNEKDKLLDCLLNDSEASMPFRSNVTDSTQKLPAFDIVKVESLLDESQVVYIKDEEQVEDMLNVTEMNTGDLNNCKIVLEDVTHRYPSLKEETTIKIARNTGMCQILGSTNGENSRAQRKKYRKRGDSHEETHAAPKRIAKLTQLEVKERLKMMKKEKSWQCPHCIKFYHIRKPFEKHLRDEHKVLDVDIKQIFKDEEEIGVLNDEIFKCHICLKIYLVEKRLLAHIKLHGPDGTLIHKCPCYCSVYFATKDEAQDHARQNHKDLLYCEICDKFMTGHDSLKNHRSIHHSERGQSQRNMKRNLVCDKCGKKYSSRTSLTDHVRSDCGRIPLYPCDICGKRLTTAGILKTHLLLHKDDTPFQCDKCGKTFKVKAQYKSHIKTRHTDYKPFKCHLCPKEYPYRESLLTHMTVHTGIKRFLCNGCGKRFTCISNLQAHRKVQADTCGALPLNAKATQYMGVQKGNLLMGAKPEAGLDYKETNTLIAKEVIDRDLPMAQELNYPTDPPAPMAAQPLNYTQPTHLLLPQMILPHFIEDSHSSY